MQQNSCLSCVDGSVFFSFFFLLIIFSVSNRALSSYMQEYPSRRSSRLQVKPHVVSLSQSRFYFDLKEMSCTFLFHILMRLVAAPSLCVSLVMIKIRSMFLYMRYTILCTCLEDIHISIPAVDLTVDVYIFPSYFHSLTSTSL